MRTSPIVLFLVTWTAPLALALANAACGGHEPEPVTPIHAPATVDAPTATTGPVATTPGLPGLPSGLPTFLPPPTGPAPGTVGGTATPVAANLAQLVAAPLAMLAQTEAPSASPAAGPMVASFQEGQTIEQSITISPGKCYTFVAAGAGPQELEISLVAATPIPGLAPLMGSAKGTGVRAVLGPKDTCVKLAIVPVDVPAKWIVRATKGGGVVAAQAYVKSSS
jgi:hypothetical protein